MLLHRPVNWEAPEHFPTCLSECSHDYAFENPARLECIRDRLQELEVRLLLRGDDNEQNDDIFIPLQCELATREEIMLAHTDSDYIDHLAATASWSEEECLAAGERDPDMYYSPDSWQAARLACGGVLRCVDAVVTTTNNNNRALAIVRPPGHHACQSQEMGFCFVNSVAVAAKYAVEHRTTSSLPESKRRVVILDWDIHHGNGTQELTYADPNILYISLHRYSGNSKKKGFFPYTGHCREIGDNESEGTNLNIAWTASGMGNTEYAAALAELILPVIVDYDPGLVLVSCGLDAAAGDLIGDCELTVPFYHAMTRSLLTAIGSETPVVVALEGGYTMHVVADCMEAVSLALLNRAYNNHHEVILPTCSESRSSDERLADARKVLEDYYSYEETNEDDEGNCNSNLHQNAVRNLNASIKAVQACSRWSSLKLRKVTSSGRRRTATLLHRDNSQASKDDSSSTNEVDMALARALQSLAIEL
jgi:acetoin utilization deacetylase AcuC-like enzyme